MRTSLKSTYIKISIHYFLLILVIVGLIKLFPGFEDFLPVGATERLFAYPGEIEIQSSAYSGRFTEGSTLEYGFFFFLCFLTSLLLAIPVGTTFLATRRSKKRTTTLAMMIVIMPVVVTGLVLIVQNSLALAFSLAGIVAGAGIRFRTNMQEFTDTLFFLVSIGIGLSAGVGALGVAFIMSVFFCYTYLTFYSLNYAGIAEEPPRITRQPEGGIGTPPDDKS